MRLTSERGVLEIMFLRYFYWEVMIPDSALVGESEAFKYIKLLHRIEIKIYKIFMKY